MLNPSKPYYKIAQFLKNNSVSRQELIEQNDPVWKIVSSSVKPENIFYHNWTSFSNKSSQNLIRMRDDRFLIKARADKLNETYVFFSCIKVEKRKVYFILTSNFFTNYSYSTKSGNSFILFDFRNLFQWARKSNFIGVKERRIKGKGLQPIYTYWVGTNVDKNYQGLENYIKILSTIKNANYSVLHRKIDKKGRIAIPDSVIEKINEQYGSLCALLKNKKCEWSKESKKAQLLVKKNLHHIVPEEWFLQNHQRVSKIINNSINIITLCQNCHEKTHSDDANTRKQMLDNILEVLKDRHQFDDFQNYLLKTVKITLPILYKIYNCNYEE